MKFLKDIKIEIVENQNQFDEVFRIITKTFKNDTPSLQPSNSQIEYQRKMDGFNSKTFIFFSVIHNNKMVGCVGLENVNTPNIQIKSLAILPNYQRKGLGRMLLEYIIKYCRNLNGESIYLGARYGKEGFYEKCGFQGTFLIQSDILSKEEIQKLFLGKSYSEYTYRDNKIHQFFFDTQAFSYEEKNALRRNKNINITTIYTIKL